MDDVDSDGDGKASVVGFSHAMTEVVDTYDYGEQRFQCKDYKKTWTKEMVYSMPCSPTNH